MPHLSTKSIAPCHDAISASDGLKNFSIASAGTAGHIPIIAFLRASIVVCSCVVNEVDPLDDTRRSLIGSWACLSLKPVQVLLHVFVTQHPRPVTSCTINRCPYTTSSRANRPR